MPDYKTPGVYIEEISKFPPSVAQVETAIPAFIGYTNKADENAPGDLLKKAVRISSFLQFETLFGGPPTQTVTVNLMDVPQPDGSNVVTPRDAVVSSPSPFKMYHSLLVYFSNGGGPCYIISTGSYIDTIAANQLDATNTVANTGGLTVAKMIDEITLYLFPDAASLTPSEYYGVYSSALDECQRLQDRFTLVDVKMNNTAAPTIANPNNPSDVLRNASLGNNLKYGAAYYPWLKTSLSYNLDTDFSASDVNFVGSAFDGNTWQATIDAGDSPLNGRFYTQVKQAISKVKIELPPSPFIAGVYAAVDRTRGVWKAPANVSLNNVIEPLVKISDQDQESLNIDVTAGKSINAIRAFTGRGIMVWGARTLAGNDNEWRYVPVRRFFNMVEESVKKASGNFVFEPNDANTWVKVRAMIENFLTLQWRAGALAGAKAEDAFFVRVGLNTTMSAQDILEGRMIVEIGMAVVRPAEFIILRFSHKMQES